MTLRVGGHPRLPCLPLPAGHGAATVAGLVQSIETEQLGVWAALLTVHYVTAKCRRGDRVGRPRHQAPRTDSGPVNSPGSRGRCKPATIRGSIRGRRVPWISYRNDYAVA